MKLLVTNSAKTFPISWRDLYSNHSRNCVVAYMNSPRVCGHPSFCSNDVYSYCCKKKLIECEKCSITFGAVIFITAVIFLGLAIVGGNTAILLVNYHRQKLSKAIEKMDLCRSSLALADMMTGRKIDSISNYTSTSSWRHF